MGFRVVNTSSFTFETDLPPSTRNIHPSGVLHAFRSTPNAAAGLPDREEHTFAWIKDSIHIENAVAHLEKFGFHRDHGIAFLPYSTKMNWLDRYPHATPSIECTDDGDVLVYLNWRPYPNGLADMGQDKKGIFDAAAAAVASEAAKGAGVGNDNDDENDTSNHVGSKKRKRRYKDRAQHSMFKDESLLPDAERDELHIGIYNYLLWFHSKLEELAEKVSSDAATTTELADDENDPEMVEEKKKEFVQHLKERKGLDVTELKGALEKLEQTFAIIPNVRLEAASAAAEEDNTSNNSADEQGEETTSTTTSTLQNGVPFLEKAMFSSVQELVLARDMAGKKRRSRMKILIRKNNPNRMHDKTPKDFDAMLQELIEYKEVHGDTLVSRFKNKENAPLAHWVRGLREKKAALLKQGIDVSPTTPETVPPGEPIRAKTLTAERLEKLEAIGFVWSISGPNTAWDVRFRELMEYYDINEKWPSQSMGVLGRWVHKQRKAYTRGDVNYMKHKAPKLDEVGFEWTPRGNTRMSWDEGFEMLMEFGRLNNHYNVPNGTDEDGQLGKSDERRLYNWVESLHKMYRSYKLGRQCGSLTDERIVLLVKHGFQFRNI